MSSPVEIYGSACERLRFRAWRTEKLVRHLPLGVFRENDFNFNKFDNLSKKAKN